MTALSVLAVGLPSAASADEGEGYARFRDFGHLSGLIGTYLSRPRGPLAMEVLDEYRLTFYWITRPEPDDGPPSVRLLLSAPGGTEDEPVDVPAPFKHRLDREGTGRLADGRVVNVLRRGETRRYLDVSQRFPTGLGSASNPLTPFKSVAINDKNPKLRFGDTIYVPDVEGMPLPDGSRHDGIFTVDDTGQGVGLDQIDVFTFVRDNWPEFQRYLQAHTQKFFVYKVYPQRAPTGR